MTLIQFNSNTRKYIHKFPSIRVALLFISALLLSGCSFEASSPEWQLKSKSAFSSYTKNFLSSHDSLAKNALNRAIRHVNVSDDMLKLARLYLATCALNISVGIEDECNDFIQIRDVVNNNHLNSYYKFIQGRIELNDIVFLPLNYQQFSILIKEGKHKSAINSLFSMKKPTSTFLAATLIKDKLSPSHRQKLMNIASHYGYKKIVIFWLKESLRLTSDNKQKKILRRKISILESTN